MFDFSKVVAEDTDCDDPMKTNTLTFRSDQGAAETFEEIWCLTDIPDGASVTYPGQSMVVEFDTVDAEMYGFVLEFTAGMTDV